MNSKQELLEKNAKLLFPNFAQQEQTARYQKLNNDLKDADWIKPTGQVKDAALRVARATLSGELMARNVAMDMLEAGNLALQTNKLLGQPTVKSKLLGQPTVKSKVVSKPKGLLGRMKRTLYNGWQGVKSVVGCKSKSTPGEAAAAAEKAAAVGEPQKMNCTPRKTIKTVLIALVVGFVVFVLLASFWLYILLAAVAFWAYLRLPFFLGWIASECITRFAMFGYPISFRTIILTPWLELRKGNSPKLWLLVQAGDFSLANPPSLKCPHKSFVTAAAVQILVTVDLCFLWPLIRRGELEPLLIHIGSIEVRQATLVFELRKHQLNINGLVRELADREVAAKLGISPGAPLDRAPPAEEKQGCSSCCKQSGKRMPNLLRVRILAARGLCKPGGSTPYVVIKARGTHIASTAGTLVYSAPGDRIGGEEWSFNQDFMLRIDDSSTVLQVCVYNDKWGPDKLIGQWFMTMKYMVTNPAYCKHREKGFKTSADGVMSGTFLLCDSAMRGSAMRTLGPEDLGEGYSGEIDMRLQWTFSPSLPPPLPAPEKSAIAQLTENSGETALRMGNTLELREMLARLPLRLSSGPVSIDEVSVSIKDLFTGSVGHIENELGSEASLSTTADTLDELAYYELIEETADVVHIKHLPLDPVSMDSPCDLNEFVERLVLRQLVPNLTKVLFTSGLLASALMQVIQGEWLAMAHLFETLGEDIAEDLKNVVTCEYCRTGCAPCRKPVPPDSSQPVSLG